jgi:cobalt-zinc-cadmium efflux system outer membrane protein
MNRRWPLARKTALPPCATGCAPMTHRLTVVLLLGVIGCAQPAFQPVSVEIVNLNAPAHRPPGPIRLDAPPAMALDTTPVPAELTGPQPVDVYIRRALEENRTVQAARANVLAMKSRIPQVTALDDPMVQNTIWPFPSNGPQYSLMGYMPYELMITQQFPWFGTLKLRGQAAEQEVKVALMELAAAQLEVVESVKRAYYDLYANERVESILTENRKLAEDFVELAKVQLETGGSQQDLLRAQVAVTELDRELVTTRQAITEAKARLAQGLHVSPETDFKTLSQMPIAEVPTQVERLYRLAVASRPEIQGRMAAVARDEREVELARKRYYPDITAGLAYGLMTRDNAQSPTADGRDNYGFVVGFNLPIYKRKLDAAVCEAEARAVADARRYDAERDATYREIKDLFTQAEAHRDTIDLLKSGILPKSTQALQVAAAGYRGGTLDYLTLSTARQEVLRVEVQVARLEAELGKTLASLEKVVGIQLNEHPPMMPPSPTSTPNPEPSLPATDVR